MSITAGPYPTERFAGKGHCGHSCQVKAQTKVFSMNVFFAAPFTSLISPATKVLDPSYHDWLRTIIGELREAGYSVTNAHERENWGAKLMPPREALKCDFASIRECDFLVAYIGNPPSPGVQMELGFGAAYKKRIIVIQDEKASLPYLVEGLAAVTETQFIKNAPIQTLMHQLRLLLKDNLDLENYAI